jgi:hypothetical protein
MFQGSNVVGRVALIQETCCHLLRRHERVSHSDVRCNLSGRIRKSRERRELGSSSFRDGVCLSVGLYFEVPATLGDCSRMQMEMLDACGEALTQYAVEFVWLGMYVPEGGPNLCCSWFRKKKRARWGGGGYVGVPSGRGVNSSISKTAKFHGPRHWSGSNSALPSLRHVTNTSRRPALQRACGLQFMSARSSRWLPDFALPVEGNFLDIQQDARRLGSAMIN